MLHVDYGESSVALPTTEKIRETATVGGSEI
jgi:hypothetical protein